MSATAAIAARSNPASQDIWRLIWNLAETRGLKAGDQLPSIRELADALKVKPTTVRDALLKAESMGLVRVLPRAGAFLQGQPTASSAGDTTLAGMLEAASTQSEPNLFHLLDARRLIEIELAGRAAERRRLEDLLPVRRALEALLNLPLDAPRADYVDHDIRFHVEIARLSGNQVLFAVQKTLMELLRPHLVQVPRDLQRQATADRSHVAIYEALVSGDADKTRSQMREHLSLAYDGMLRDLQQLPAVSPPSACES